MFLNLYFCFQVKQQAFQLLSDFNFTRLDVFFRLFPYLSLLSSLKPQSQPSPKLTLVYPFGIKNLKAIAYLPKKYYLCVEMSGKGSISRMSDECLMKGKSCSLYFGEYQAGTRKFTLARKPYYYERSAESPPRYFFFQFTLIQQV